MMNNDKNLVDYFRDIPNTIKTAIGLTTLIIGFIMGLLKNIYLGILVLVGLTLVYLAIWSITVVFSAKFVRYRLLGCLGLALVPFVIIVAFVAAPIRSFVTSALFEVNATLQAQSAEKIAYGNGPVTIQQIVVGESDSAYP